MKYLYRTEKNHSFDINLQLSFSNEWVAFSIGGTMWINPGYAWNGCSPKFSFLDLFWIGTPEGILDYRTGNPITYNASMVHDALLQFSIVSHKEADKIFYKMLKEADFKLAFVYYIGVRVVSSFMKLLGIWK